MAIVGDKSGIPSNTPRSKKVEPLISVTQLKERYLFGIVIKDADGNELPERVYQNYIDNAVSMLEHYLDLSITPVIGHEEERDYHFNEYTDWGFMMLNYYPVLRVQKIEMIYFRDVDGTPDVIQELPNNWIRLESDSGIIRLIPNARFPASLQVGSTGSYFPEVLRTNMVPNLWRITYDYGFEDGKIPTLMNQVIGLLASIQALNIGGDLVVAAGIASTSISLDSLSQSINTTASAENHAYSAKLKEYQNQIFGKTKDDQFALLKILKNYYKGQDLQMI